jgi:uncharacterized protein (TIGR03435 family)
MGSGSMEGKAEAMIESACPPGFRIAVLLGTALVLVVAAPPALGIAQTPGGTAVAASSETTKLPEWDVVSVRPVDAKSCTGNAGMSTTTDGISIFCIPVLFAIEQAYMIHEPSRILGAPDWVKNSMYDIDAKVAGEDVEAFHKLSRGEHSRMLQPLLAERFHLKAHIEQREMPVYNLVVVKGGSKLKAATADDASKGSHMMTNGKGNIDAVNAVLTGLPGILYNEVGRPVVDKTGLTGKYDFTVDYVPASKAATDESGGPSIFTALEEQLGLKLEPAKAPLDVLVIDSIEQPAAN